MITDKDREILRPIIGKTYAPDVLKILNERRITNGTGGPLSNSFIRRIYLGHMEHVDVELAIFDLYDQIKEKNKKLAERRAALAGE